MMLYSLRTASIVGLATIGCVVAIDDTRNPVSAAAAYVFGYVKVQVALTASSGIPNGTTISLYASIDPEDAMNFAYSDASASPSPKVVAGKVTATFVIPYRWLVTDRSEKISIGVYASGFGTNVYDTSSLVKEVVIPANGTVTTVSFTGTI